MRSIIDEGTIDHYIFICLKYSESKQEEVLMLHASIMHPVKVSQRGFSFKDG